MQPITLLTSILKSGQIGVSANNNQLIQLSINNKNIDLNIIDHRFLIDLLKNDGQTKSFLQLLAQLKTLAEDLKDQRITITLSFEGSTLVTIGSDAKANFSRFITGTKQIEINNLQKLVKIALF
ncbi:MAG: hypothetical protein P8Y18_01350 [Candidatus Bathyarchaeota archaeon]